MNIILITVDALRLDRLGCYGNRDGLTPGIDSLAGQSTVFEQAITAGSWTQAAFPAIITSTYPSMYGGCLGPLSPDRPSPVEALRGEGFHTRGFVSNPWLERRYGYQRGFNEFVELRPAQAFPFYKRITILQALLRRNVVQSIGVLLKRRWIPPRMYASAESVLARALEGLIPGRSSFTWAHLMDVHWPYHREDQLRQPVEIAQAWRDVAHYHAAAWQGAELGDHHRRRYTDLYEQALAYLDEQISRFIDELRRRGIWEETLFILTADHGEEFFDHGRWGHVEINLHDEILRIPLILHAPGQSAIRRVDSQVRSLDTMPTILSLAGCQSPPGMLGIDLAGFVQGRPVANLPAEAICERPRGQEYMLAVRTEQYKYIWDRRNPSVHRLYALRQDPTERENLADRFPETAHKFQTTAQRHLEFVSRFKMSTAVPEAEEDEMVKSRLRGLGYLE